MHIFLFDSSCFPNLFFDQAGSIDVKLNRFLLQNASALCIRGNLHAV